MESPQLASLHSVYHAVYVPLDDGTTEGEEMQLHVYRDKVEALKIIKKYKKGRLKTFKTLEEAQEFARNGLESVLPNPLANSVPTIFVTEEKANNFKAPKPQNLTQFRKLIEYGDVKSVISTVWENPRYLVSSGDTPTILHEGCRYNALHIAVKVRQCSKMCELILNTVGDPSFIKLFYGDSSENQSYVDRASILQDLYLNTPDKGLNETPLHFATKFGLKDCVQTLVLYPQCLKTPLNKYHQTPADIICTRKSIDDKILINEIRSLLEEQFFVPLIRAEDNSLQPMIGEPFSPNNPPQIKVDPISPQIKIRAYAGPMTKEKAAEFRKKWKTPPRIFGTPIKKMNMSGDCNGLRSPDINLSLRLQDTDKGLERVGRELASECQVPWKEYWPFLQDFVDLRSTEGLEMLESFFENQFQKKSKADYNLENSFMNSIKISEQKNEIKLDNICDQFQSLTLEAQTDEGNEDDSEFVTPPSSPLRLNNNVNNESSDEDDMDLANDNMKEEIFFEGKTPSKIDFAVLTAIPSTIDVYKYPFIYLWRHEMQLANKRLPKNLSFKRKLFK